VAENLCATEVLGLSLFKEILHTMIHTHQTPLHHCKLGIWQRAMDILLELHNLNQNLGSRDFELIGKPIWKYALLMLSEITLMSQSTTHAERSDSLLKANKSLHLLKSTLDVARQLRLFDIDPEFVRQLERQRIELEHYERTSGSKR